jgi:hypothetical protein
MPPLFPDAEKGKKIIHLIFSYSWLLVEDVLIFLRVKVNLLAPSP